MQLQQHQTNCNVLRIKGSNPSEVNNNAYSDSKWGNSAHARWRLALPGCTSKGERTRQEQSGQGARGGTTADVEVTRKGDARPLVGKKKNGIKNQDYRCLVKGWVTPQLLQVKRPVVFSVKKKTKTQFFIKACRMVNVLFGVTEKQIFRYSNTYI